MRILIVVPMVPQADGLGAIPKLLHAQLQGLRERADVTVVGTFGELHGQAEAAAALSRDPQIDAHFADRRRAGTASRRWRVRAELATAWARGGRPWRAVSLGGGVQPLLDRVAAEREFDVVSVEDDFIGLRFPAGVPIVLTEHEAEREPPAERSLRPASILRRLDWKRLAGFQPRSWAAADLIQVYAERDAGTIAARAPELAGRIRVDPFGIELPAAADPGRERPDLILFTGTFTHPPNRDAARWLAAEIMPAVRARRPQAVLRVVGSAPPRELRAELDRPGIELVADAPGVAPHLEEAAVVIAPVRSGGGMRLKVVEAMAAGKAIVTAPIGADGFTHFEPKPPLAIGDGPAALAELTAELLADDGARRRLGSGARTFAERNLSPGAWAERQIGVYEEAVEIGRRKQV